MPLELKKISPATLRSMSLDEKWLQDRIEDDPSILGLGDLQLVKREKMQPTGGRIDFVLWDPDQERRYEVEVMLGKLDESHIIRAIEYWDIERQRYPSYEHHAVIVAEEITARFFNVIRLLNRAVPLIALQLNAFTIDNGVVLHFTKVLDVYAEADVEDDVGGGQVDRHFWEKKASPEAITALDKVVGLVQARLGIPRVTYNKNHIALGTKGVNFCWFHPPKQAKHCHIRLRTDPDHREDLIKGFEETGLYVRPFQQDRITIKLTPKDVDTHAALLEALLRDCEQSSVLDSST